MQSNAFDFKLKYDARVRFSFHCFSIINFSARVWIVTKWIQKRSTQTAIDLSWFVRMFLVCVWVCVSVCVRKVSSTISFLCTQTYGSETCYFFLFFLVKVTQNEPNCQNNKRMTSLQTRDLSFTTNQATGTANIIAIVLNRYFFFLSSLYAKLYIYFVRYISIPLEFIRLDLHPFVWIAGTNRIESNRKEYAQ